MSVEMLQFLFYLCALGAVVSLLLVVVSPYRLQQGQHSVSQILPANIRQELETLNAAWAGKIRITTTQQWLLSIMALIAAPIIGMVLNLILEPTWSISLTGLVAFLGVLYPHQKFRGGFPRTLLDSLEREAMLVAAFMYRARGVSGLSVQVSFQQFMEMYEDTETAALLRAIPEGNSYADELLLLKFPANEVANWLNVISTLATINDLGDPKMTLQKMRDQTRDKEVEYLKKIIKGKAFKAPAFTVLIILPGLMAIMLGSIILQAVQGLGGGF